jgi:FecR-like protein
MSFRVLLNFLAITALLLSACSSAGTNAPQTTPTNPADSTPRVAATATSVPERQAVFKLVLNQVEFRTTAIDSFTSAAPEDVLKVNGQAQTGESGKARLDLLPEGSIIRLGPSTSFVLQELQSEPSDPVTKIKLAFGKLWIVLTGGELDIQTPNGQAAVRGSFMSVDFDAQTKHLRVTCLEGHCELKTDLGAVELIDGQFSEILAEGLPPTTAAPMTEADYKEWQQVSPEAQQLIAPIVTPTSPELVPGGPIPTKPLSFSITNQCSDPNTIGGDWLWTFTRLPDEKGEGFTEMVHVPVSQTVSGEFPPGFYSITDIFPNGEQHQSPTPANSDNSQINVTGCAVSLAPPNGGSATLIPPGGTLITPTELSTTYSLTNNCTTVWHWVFTGTQVITVDVPPGQTVSGTLPPGTYTVTDFFDNGLPHGPSLVPAGGRLNVTSCTP